MSSVKDGYNGWANRSTWNVILWLNNRVDLNFLMIDSFTRQGWERDAASVKRFCYMVFGEKTPDGDLLKEVNWDEVAKVVEESID